MKRTNQLLTVLTAATVIVMMATTALPVSADGGDDQEEGNAGASAGPPTNGQIVFRRYFNADQTMGALFAIDPDGNNVRRITFPPMAGGTTFRHGPPMERRSSSSASRPTARPWLSW